MVEEAEHVARAYQDKYARLWNSSGPEAVAKLYSPNAILAIRQIADGREQILATLKALFEYGWTSISINVLYAREATGVVIVVSEFTAFGSGAIEGDTLSGKSCHTLIQVDGVWLSAMHGAL